MRVPPASELIEENNKERQNIVTKIIKEIIKELEIKLANTLLQSIIYTIDCNCYNIQLKISDLDEDIGKPLSKLGYGINYVLARNIRYISRVEVFLKDPEEK